MMISELERTSHCINDASFLGKVMSPTKSPILPNTGNF